MRSWLYATLRNLRFGSRKISVGNSPCNQKFSRSRVAKEHKFAKLLGICPKSIELERLRYVSVERWPTPNGI
jgi:hypothetical protein